MREELKGLCKLLNVQVVYINGRLGEVSLKLLEMTT